ncbi:MAG: guanylate cyclase, partial [Actinomycetota bacterium]|nr:guanylate cyclase [Actinomycetota bacterium]
ARAVREVASGGSVLDPKIVEALIRPVSHEGDLSPSEDELLRMVAEGRPIKAIAVARNTTAADVADSIERLFVRLAQGLSAGNQRSLHQLKQLQQAIVEREEQGETLSRLLPGGIAEKLLAEGRRVGETERLEVTVLMSDVRGYSSIAERTDPSVLAGQLQQHREAMNHAIIATGGTVMQFVGDAVMGVFGAPVACPDHADRALAAALAMHAAQTDVNARWEAEGLAPFGLGIGLSTGVVTAGILGSEERAEYSVVGDTVNLTQRIQEWAGPGETVLIEATYKALRDRIDAEALEPSHVKGRRAAVVAYRIPRR